MQQTNLALKKLHGIKPKGVKVRPDSKLERLLGVGDLIIKEFAHLRAGRRIASDSLLHLDIRDRLESEYFFNFSFSEADLVDFVHVAAESKYHEVDSFLLGMYSGVLLSLLTERNKQENKRTKIYIDGNKKEFPYLFSYAQYFDELIVENFRGEKICDRLTYDTGSGNLLAFSNLEGSNFGWFSGIGTKSIKDVYFINNSFLEFCAPYLHGKDVWFINNKYQNGGCAVKAGICDSLWLLNNFDPYVRIHAGDTSHLDTFFVVSQPFCNLNFIEGKLANDLQIIKNFILCSDPDTYIQFKSMKFNNSWIGKAAIEKYKPIVELSHSLIGEKDTLTIIEKSKQIKELYGTLT
ncbi:hypothetical protein HOK51_07795 [Candidatus Woesearchaeota archaeon]|jgi:hypothetical protein|nr:hypothetical protein [Candidatus Woesearchaeota archaeon]MBT6519727.1 hypothetical protein [Candidatus Woesearchaeota archaeon]MBT7368107.1 hypothetical protein [Candidatus Woesearchaeota archaeon]